MTPAGSARIKGRTLGYRAAIRCWAGVRRAISAIKMLPVGIVGPLQSEILAPVEQHIGGRIGPEEIAQPAKLAGMLLVKEDRLQVQPVEKHQPLQAVGPLDVLGGSTEAVSDPRDQVTNRSPARSHISP